MCAAGYGDFWVEKHGITTGGHRDHRDVSFFGTFNATDSIPMIPIHETSGGVTIAVKIHPRARKNALAGQIGDALKVSLTAPPVDGKANEACVEFFAKLLKVPRTSVTIASGATSRNKVICVAGVSREYVIDLLRS